MEPFTSPAWDASQSRPLVHHDCGTEVRLYSDGWGFCPECRTEFHGAGRPVVQQP